MSPAPRVVGATLVLAGALYAALHHSGGDAVTRWLSSHGTALLLSDHDRAVLNRAVADEAASLRARLKAQDDALAALKGEQSAASSAIDAMKAKHAAGEPGLRAVRASSLSSSSSSSSIHRAIHIHRTSLPPSATGVCVERSTWRRVAFKPYGSSFPRLAFQCIACLVAHVVPYFGAGGLTRWML